MTLLRRYVTKSPRRRRRAVPGLAGTQSAPNGPLEGHVHGHLECRWLNRQHGRPRREEVEAGTNRAFAPRVTTRASAGRIGRNACMAVLPYPDLRERRRFSLWIQVLSPVQVRRLAPPRIRFFSEESHADSAVSPTSNPESQQKTCLVAAILAPYPTRRSFT